jgi:hypothetical protein
MLITYLARFAALHPGYKALGATLAPPFRAPLLLLSLRLYQKHQDSPAAKE